ncbi:MAG: sulfopyruvate decarboxylase subunit beta [Thermoanaerobaculaceae bacterium]|nr:sulfopyruvate decarboxylase subunit beta [Thermoanaerobaculaceae bacterium]
MNRSDAIRICLACLAADDIVVASDGAISREVYAVLDRPRTFYMLGSMGQVGSIALGLAMTRFERVIALDGDGNFLMGTGGAAMIGGVKPANLYHLVLDNGVYGTTGGQPTLSRQVDLAALALGVGYRWARRCFSDMHAPGAVEQWLAARGPAFLALAIDEPEERPAPRIPLTPETMATRLRAALEEG